MFSSAIRHILCALAAATLVSVVATGAIADGKRRQPIIFDHSGLVTQGTGANANAATAFSSQGRRQPTTTHYEFRWWQDYTNGGR